MDRRLFLASAFASPLLPQSRTQGAHPDPQKTGVLVPAGEDRDKQVLKLGGVFPTQFKVTTKDSGGGLLVLEHADMSKGGPPRHVHFEQDEWFYAIKGEFVFEVGDEKFRLRPGDSVFGPRKVPHAWAYVGDTPGTLLIAVSPAGSFETFIRDAAKLAKPPTPEEDVRAFAAHGMKLLGPPLKVD